MNLRQEHHAHSHSWIASKNAPTRNSGILPRRSTVPFKVRIGADGHAGKTACRSGPLQARKTGQATQQSALRANAALLGRLKFRVGNEPTPSPKEVLAVSAVGTKQPRRGGLTMSVHWGVDRTWGSAGQLPTFRTIFEQILQA